MIEFGLLLNNAFDTLLDSGEIDRWSSEKCQQQKNSESTNESIESKIESFVIEYINQSLRNLKTNFETVSQVNFALPCFDCGNLADVKWNSLLQKNTNNFGNNHIDIACIDEQRKSVSALSEIKYIYGGNSTIYENTPIKTTDYNNFIEDLKRFNKYPGLPYLYKNAQPIFRDGNNEYLMFYNEGQLYLDICRLLLSKSVKQAKYSYNKQSIEVFTSNDTCLYLTGIVKKKNKEPNYYNFKQNLDSVLKLARNKKGHFSTYKVYISNNDKKDTNWLTRATVSRYEVNCDYEIGQPTVGESNEYFWYNVKLTC